MFKRLLLIGTALTVILALCLGGGAYWGHRQLSGSLPELDGRITVEGPSAEVTIERDNLGIPTLRAANRKDLAFATGFVHGQDRYFQMDLLRRNSAGELAELVGKGVLEQDRQVRVHQFRQRAKKVIELAPDDQRGLIEAYAQGVNAGLKSLKVAPYEYLALGVTPSAWKPEDCALVLFSMYLDLQGDAAELESDMGLMHDLLPEPLFDFLAPKGTEWDAPIEGEALAMAPVPGAEVYDLRSQPAPAEEALPKAAMRSKERFSPGSNNWAVAGKLTKHGGAILADDMHLGIQVPNIWYRARFVWPGDEPAKVISESGETEPPAAERTEEGQPPANTSPSKDPGESNEYQITGVTLPGTPAMVVGSNGFIAWGFTNTQGDWADLVVLEPDPKNPDAYLTPDGPRLIEHEQETIQVMGGPNETLTVEKTIWGPVIDRDHQGRRRALRWVAYDPEGVNLGLIAMEAVRTIEDAVELANLSGSPAQNFVVADSRGRIAWTVLGRIPKREGFEGRLPTSWADGKHRWNGWLEPKDYPRVIDPPEGRIWTANARVVSGENLAKMGFGGYDLGARATQIRDDLRAIDTATEADMLNVQLDDKATFLERWQRLILEALTSEALAADERRAELKKFVEDWEGRAAIDSVGFSIVREFRQILTREVLNSVTRACHEADQRFDIVGIDLSEGPCWALLKERPEHLLNPKYQTWDEAILAAIDEVIHRFTQDGKSIADHTWGSHNTTRIQHPLSRAVPELSRWLDMPAIPLPGDSADMPRIQRPASGASERMAVSPGRESEGYLHMPGGQSGHFLSPHYADGYQAWCEGEPTPFLPGETMHTLVLVPKAAH